MSSSSNSQLNDLQESIAARLRKVCCDWPLDRFEAMVHNLAMITIKYERQMLPYDPADTDDLVKQMKELRQRSSDWRRGGEHG